MRLAIVFAYLTCAGIWGTTYFAIRVSIAPGGFATYTAAALRFVIAAALLAGVVAVARVPRPSWRQVGWICAGALANFAGYALLYTAEQAITGALACVIYATQPLLTAVVMAATRTERTPWASVVGALVSLAGVALLFGDRLAVSREQAVGVAVMMGAVGCATVSNYVLKRHAIGVNPLAQNAWFLGTIAAGMTVLAVVAGGRLPVPPPVAPSLAILYLAVVGSVIAFGAWFFLIARVKLMTATTIVLVQPVIALVVDALWERQALPASSYLGVAVTLAGLGVSLFVPALRASSPRPARVAAPPSPSSPPPSASAPARRAVLPSSPPSRPAE